MAEAYYEPTPATDGASMNPVPGAVFQVFEISDTTFSTPLSLRVGAGNPTTTVAASDTLATLPGVYVTSPNYEHHWKSGAFVWRRDSIDGAKKSIEQSASLALSAANSAADAADAASASASLVNAPADTVLATLAANPSSAFATQVNTTIAGLTGGGRIVRVMEGDPLPALREGDLIVRYEVPGDLYALNFNGGTHAAPVTNLTKISGTDWPTVTSASEAVGAENTMVLRITGADTYYTIPELVADPFKDNAEILVRYRHSAATQHGPQIYFFADDTYANGFYVSFTGSSTANGAAKVRNKVGTAHNDIASVSIPVVTSGKWVMMRARCQNNTLSFKVWAVENPEPAEWTVSATVSTTLAKRFAIGRTSNQSSQHLDWVSVATGGKTAVEQ